VVTSAKTNLKPNCRPRSAEQRFEVERAHFRQRNVEPRQQQSDTVLLGGPKRSAAAPSKKETMWPVLQSGVSEGPPQLFDQVQPLPREAAVGIRRAAEMAVCGGAGIYRLVQAEMRTYAPGR
jgi:hypothetical protein